MVSLPCYRLWPEGSVSLRRRLFELNSDGFRAIAVAEHGRCTLYSRNGNAFGSFSDLPARIADHLMFRRVVLDGGIVCLDRNGVEKSVSIVTFLIFREITSYPEVVTVVNRS